MNQPALPSLGALACACAFALLGYYVTRAPLGWPDTLAPRLFGRGVAIARVFTISGYARAIALVLALGLIVSLLSRASLVPITVIALLQIVSQYAVGLVKLAFGRTRPARWRFRQELGRSYPSGHATTATVTYGLLLWLVVHDVAPAPLRYAAAVAIGLWIAGICWSRIALGAHYPTDVIGGALFGAAFALGGLVLLR